jgi:sporulation protein YlmC with PRC-barrel domain
MRIAGASPGRIFRAVGADDGNPVHYNAVRRGTPVYASDGSQVGVVDEVVDNYREHILDGFVIEDASGELRFVDAPEVARTAERAVRLNIDSAAAAQLPTPERAAPEFKPRRSGRLGKLLGGNWRRR